MAIQIGTKVRLVDGTADEEVKTCPRKDIEAQSLIGLNVNSSIASETARCETQKAMLNKLISLYGTKTEVNLEVLSIFTFVYNENKTVAENCMEIKVISEELSNENDPMKETWIMTRILNMLPAKLAHFRTSWDSVIGALKTVENLIE